MAHSILEFSDRHFMIRDAELLEVLQTLQKELDSHSVDSLSFVGEFLASDMIHVTGGIDPKLDDHLDTFEVRTEFSALVDRVLVMIECSEADRLHTNLQKLRDLVSCE